MSGRSGSGDDGGDISSKGATGFVSEDPPTLENEGTRNNTVITAYGGYGVQVGKAHRCPGSKIFMHGFCGVGIGMKGYGKMRKFTRCVRNESG